MLLIYTSTNQALHRTAFPLRSKAAAEHQRYASRATLEATS